MSTWALAAATPTPPGEVLLAVLLHVVVGLVVAAGVGAAMAIAREIVPGVAGAADRALERTGMKRLLLMGVLPLLGVGLLGQLAHQAGNETLSAVVGLGVFVPAALLLLVGLLAALPYLGRRLLEKGEPRSALARAVGGGIALGLGATTAWLPPLFALLALLVGGWLLGIGLSTLVGRRSAGELP